MRRFRRFAAAASAALFLQLVLAGSGIACVTPAMHSNAASDGAATTEMAGMPGMAGMGGMEMPASDSSSPAPSNEPPCQLPWAPGGCQPMAPCAASAVAAAAWVISAPPVAPMRIDPLDVLTPSSPTSQPEPPPPRA